MKFEKIKVGDTVFTQRKVSYGWNSAEIFYVPEKVTRVTKTQFTVESGDRYKKEGNKIGDSWTEAYFEGDYREWYSKSVPVSDETEQKKEFEIKIKIERKINNEINILSIPLNSDLTIQELKEIALKIEEIKKIINKKKL